MEKMQPTIREVSRSIVKPHPGAAGDSSNAEHPRRCEMSVWDLSSLSLNYIQVGHLFTLPPHAPHIDVLLNRLKTSLSVTLRYFYPLAGILATEMASEGDGMYLHIDCDDRGAEFIHAVADGVSVADVLAPFDNVPGFVRRLFPLDRPLNYDGHSLPLLAVQVTELTDGIFLGFSFNHAVGDGTSFWNFLNAWAEVSRSSADGCGYTDVQTIYRKPVLERSFADEVYPIKLPFTDADQFIERFSPPPLREKIFHFTAQSVARLKARANEEGGTGKISSFQALSALIWRCITRVRKFPDEQTTTFVMAADNRRRMRPPLSPDYFGNSLYGLTATTTVGELLSHDLGWAAGLLNQIVVSHTDAEIRFNAGQWMISPMVYTYSGAFGSSSILMSQGPRFDMYGCDFGWGKALAVRSGSGDKVDGVVLAYPGREGGGSIDLEVSLLPERMTALEADEELRDAVSPAGWDLPHVAEPSQ